MAAKDHRDLACSLRRRATDAERELWRQLRAELPLERTYFRRQVPIGAFVRDFACFRHRLIIELDGGQHGIGMEPQRDAERTEILEAHGFRLLRFWNHQVFTQTDAVLDTILAAIEAGCPAGEEPMSNQPRQGLNKDAHRS